MLKFWSLSNAIQNILTKAWNVEIPIHIQSGNLERLEMSKFQILVSRLFILDVYNSSPRISITDM